MNPTQKIYSLRTGFSIIGLTGTMGSGCSYVAKLLNEVKDKVFTEENSEKLYRLPNAIQILKQKDGSIDEEKLHNTFLFKRKYEMCYNFNNVNWKKYTIIDYKKVVILYSFVFYIKKNEEDFIDALFELVKTNFKKADKADIDFDDTPYLISKEEFIKAISKNKLKKLHEELMQYDGIDELLVLKNSDKLKTLCDLFYNSSIFNDCYNLLMKLFEEKYYYLRTLFFHKVACNIRQTGDPNKDKSENQDFLYHTAMLINRLIKAYKQENKDNCHIVIDSLKNSLELMFFKERYSAFYMMSVNTESKIDDKLNLKIPNGDNKKDIIARLIKLDKTEYKTKDFKDGIFSSPDVENCIQKSEIHLSNNDNNSLESLPNEFTTVYEQLFKYIALIQQPGIITPSNIERCMQIAFNSKANSGCISRQVGAVITDSSYAVKAVGWNDVPKQSIPCLLRNVNDVLDNTKLEKHEDKIIDKTYSEFEIQESTFKYGAKKKNDGTIMNEKYIDQNFSENMKLVYDGKVEKINKEGKNCSFCFKSNHNLFEGEDNQVHTRSLHAEENAMLQISKYGGQGIKGGVLFTTASPCELCAKKAYQLGIKTIFYIDPYPGISMLHVLKGGFDAPKTRAFTGVIGRSFNKLYEPIISYKDEIGLYLKANKPLNN